MFGSKGNLLSRKRESLVGITKSPNCARKNELARLEAILAAHRRKQNFIGIHRGNKPHGSRIIRRASVEVFINPEEELVVSSVAIPLGTIMPTRPATLIIWRVVSAKMV